MRLFSRPRANGRRPDPGAEAPAVVETATPRPPYASVAQFFAQDIPILIPCFNAVTYARSMVAQLRARGMRNILLIDNASTYPPMLDYLSRPADGVRVIALGENLGPRHILTDPLNFAMLPEVFCLTDPDLEFNPRMPADFVAHLLRASHHLKCGKVGLALDIADRDAMVQDDFLIEGPQKIWEHEARFWRYRAGELPGGDPVYTAEIDTTFALYNKRYFAPEPLAMFLRAMRVGGAFTCRHRPWYRDNGLPIAEETYYRETARDSFYLKRVATQKTRDE